MSTLPTIDLATPPPAPAGTLQGLPRRVALTLPELRLLAEKAGGAEPERDAPRSPIAGIREDIFQKRTWHGHERDEPAGECHESGGHDKQPRPALPLLPPPKEKGRDKQQRDDLDLQSSGERQPAEFRPSCDAGATRESERKDKHAVDIAVVP